MFWKRGDCFSFSFSFRTPRQFARASGWAEVNIFFCQLFGIKLLWRLATRITRFERFPRYCRSLVARSRSVRPPPCRRVFDSGLAARKKVRRVCRRKWWVRWSRTRKYLCRPCRNKSIRVVVMALFAWFQWSPRIHRVVVMALFAWFRTVAAYSSPRRYVVIRVKGCRVFVEKNWLSHAFPVCVYNSVSFSVLMSRRVFARRTEYAAAAEEEFGPSRYELGRSIPLLIRLMNLFPRKSLGSSMASAPFSIEGRLRWRYVAKFVFWVGLVFISLLIFNRY